MDSITGEYLPIHEPRALGQLRPETKNEELPRRLRAFSAPSVPSIRASLAVPDRELGSAAALGFGASIHRVSPMHGRACLPPKAEQSVSGELAREATAGRESWRKSRSA